MIDGRRTFLTGLAGLVAGSLMAAQQGAPTIPSAQDKQPGGPQGRFPGSARNNPPDDDESGPTPDPHAILKQNEKDIKKDMAELETLVSDLRKQVDTIDSSNVLSLDMVHNAEEIEKLAREIKTLARGV